ncbi:3083_t:CDS:2 [Diversispora eburnea]|uniref:3083_t:CDS:1 n=1 Tax=Diversispora eburnea TaxID=1213867 RepID=A0A9N8YWN1_9GLOM|nr:3083_t:CDS:2 [Diversispora eburnea]
MVDLRKYSPQGTLERSFVWHFYTDNRTPKGDLVPILEFEVETIDNNDQIQQYMINIKLECLFHGIPSTFQTSSSIPNPLIIDFYHILCAMKGELEIL